MSVPSFPIAVEAVDTGIHGSIVYVPVIAGELNPFNVPITSAVYVASGVKPVNRCPAAASAADTVAVSTGHQQLQDYHRVI